MATFALIHGAASDSWYWHLVVPELEARGHDVVAPTLPADADDLADCADEVVNVIGDRAGRSDLIVVAQSLGGFTAPLVCERVRVDLLILLAAMIPAPGETFDEWWENTRYQEARKGREFDVMADFFHDVPPAVTAEAMARGEREGSGTAFAKPWPMSAWPDVPTRFLLCTNDQFFPADFMRRVVRERLGITPDEFDSGHLPALAHPKELAARLDEYAANR